MKKLLLASALFLSMSANAALMSGEKLLHDLRSNPVLATGYISGVADTISGEYACPADGFDIEPLVKFVKFSLEINPAERGMSGDNFVAYAMIKMFPCADKK